MDSWQSTTAAPGQKLEHSPAESFLSAPGEMYPSLFGDDESESFDPSSVMTPRSLKDDVDLPVTPEKPSPAPADTPAAGTEKKTAKKRKSWGQVLPEPKTNLPPRKRAKTEDEKEQRRVERVLRNRRAAQSSRERKRQEVEALEEKNKILEQQVLHFQKLSAVLAERLNKVQGNSGAAIQAENSLSLSQELFRSHDGYPVSAVAGLAESQSLDDLLRSAQSAPTTCNPASISPALSPVAEPVPFPEQPAATAAAAKAPAAPEAAVASSPDSTQHPAEMLWSDLQCRSAEASRPFPAAALAQPRPLPRPLPSALATYMQLTLLLTSASTILSACRRPLTQIAMSLRAGFCLAPTAPILNTIIWLVTRPSRSRPTRTSTSTTSSATSSSCPWAAPTPSPSATLRLRLLQKILTCSPLLARPLSDATLAALRLVQSEERRGVDRVVRGQDGRSAAAEPDCVLGEEGAWLSGAALPSKEVLLTLLWAIRVVERKGAGRPLTSAAKIDAPPPSSTPTLDNTGRPDLVLKVQRRRRARELGRRQLG